MKTGIIMCLVLIAIAPKQLIQALLPAPIKQSGMSVCSGTILFRVGVCMLSVRQFVLKRLLYFIRGVSFSRRDSLPQKLSGWGMTCIARASAMAGRVYGLAASDMARTAYPKNEKLIGVSSANPRLTQFVLCSHIFDYNSFALIKNQKSKI